MRYELKVYLPKSVCYGARMDQSIFRKIIDSSSEDNQSAFARRLGVSPQMLQKWRNNRVPAHYVVRMSKLTEGEVTPHQIRPDVFLAQWRV